MNESETVTPRTDQTPDDARMMMFHIPDDQNILVIIGIISLRHSHLDHVLRMTIKSLVGVTVEEALDATKYEGSATLRRRIRKLARQKLGEGKPLLQLQALLTRCERTTHKRNRLIHSIWAQELDGDAFVQTENHDWEPIPTFTSLDKLSDELLRLTQELNAARLDGFLFEALDDNKLAKN